MKQELIKAIKDGVAQTWQEHLAKKIHMAGGTANLPGLVARLNGELGSEYLVRYQNERGYAHSWVGASILGSLATFQKMWVSPGEFEVIILGFSFVCNEDDADMKCWVGMWTWHCP